MEIVNGKAILGTLPCSCATFKFGPGKTYRTFPHTNRDGSYCIKARCPFNKTGKRGYPHDYKEPVIVTCGACNGTAIVPENYCDHIQVPAEMPILVIRQNRSLTFNEQYLGLHTVYSTEDNGRGNGMTDEALIAEVRERINEFEGPQLVNLVRNKTDLTLCDALAVYVAPAGYSVRPYWNEQGPKQFSGVSAEDAIRVGVVASRHGMNGTLIAAEME